MTNIRESRMMMPAVILITFLLILGTSTLVVDYFQGKENASVEEVEAIKDPQIEILTEKYEELAAIVETLTGQPVLPVDEILEGKPQTGIGPTNEQVREIVVQYFLANPPESGRPPTTEEIDRAVAVYCASNNCRGEPGETVVGRDGTNGIDGANATDQQIADAVSAFCAAHGDCLGPTGPPGPFCSEGFHREVVTFVAPPMTAEMCVEDAA